jgi:predicted DNA-binding transcriptional regulator AlpA
MVVTMSTIGRETGSLISRTTAYQLEKYDPDFPKRIRLPFKKRGSGWFWDDIRSYLEVHAVQAVIDQDNSSHIKRVLRQRAQVGVRNPNLGESGE